jgi:hypothetical protein
MKNLVEISSSESFTKFGKSVSFRSIRKGAFFAIFSMIAFALSIIVLSSFSGGPVPDESISLTFVDHIQAGMIEQDVYVEKVKGSGEVYRVLPSEKEDYLNNELFRTFNAQKHDPFDAQKAGPYKKGESLEITLADWLQAKGSAEYVCQDGWGIMNAQFENLVPNASYTMWHFFMSAPPTVPFNGTLDVPLGDRDGTQSVFTTDADGNATIELKFENCLQMSNVQTMGGLAIAYHSDGKTYGGAPGPFGTVTHVQLFTVLPDVNDIR